MAEIFKPTSLNNIWADNGDRIKPSDDKIQMGWLVEIPARQHFNWLENRRDTAIAHINQRGIAQWDALTDYIAGRSYTQGSNGVIYRSVLNSRGKDPTVDSVHWSVAFASLDDPVARKAFVGYTATTGSLTAQPNYKYYFTNSASLYLPTGGGRGDSIVVNKSPESTIIISIEGGGEIHTYRGGFEEIIYDYFDEINFVYNGTQWEVM